MIRAVLFDAAHTLVDPDPPSARVYADIGARHGRRVTEEGLKAALAPLWWSLRAEKTRVTAVSGTNDAFERAWWRNLVDRAYRDAGEERGVGDECFEEIFRHFGRGAGWRVFPEVGEVLSALRARGLKLGVLSNFDSRLRAVLEDLRLGISFDTVTISSEAGWEKPHPNIYRSALLSLGVGAAEALMVGDDWEHDVEGPGAVGIRALWLRRAPAKPDPRPSIASLTEVLGAL